MVNKFRVEDEVKFIDGRWWWALPDGLGVMVLLALIGY